MERPAHALLSQGSTPVCRLRVVHCQARVELGVADFHSAHSFKEAEVLAMQQLAQLQATYELFS